MKIVITKREIEASEKMQNSLSDFMSELGLTKPSKLKVLLGRGVIYETNLVQIKVKANGDLVILVEEQAVTLALFVYGKFLEGTVKNWKTIFENLHSIRTTGCDAMKALENALKEL
jgi:hypothetical protein